MDDADFLQTLIAQARDSFARGATQPAKLLLDRVLMTLAEYPAANDAAARKDVAALLLDLDEPERAVYALGDRGSDHSPSLLRRATFETAARMRAGIPPQSMASPLIRRLIGLPGFSPDEIRRTGREIAGLFDPFEALSQNIARPAIDDTQVYSICMMPRSGSNFLVQCLTETGVLGQPGEYLHRNEPTALPSIAARFQTPTLDAAMAEIMARTRSPNGVFGIKVHIGMLLPLLIEGTFAHTLAHGKFIYTTRDDLLAQAISFVRAQMTGVWLSKNEADGEAKFDFDRIRTTITDLSTMMTQWETFFAFHGIQPLRITYEAINRNVDDVVAAIADYLGVSLKAPTNFRARRETVQRDGISQAWRQKFLAQAGAPVS
jgi:LPS sulfotransferase NodH